MLGAMMQLQVVHRHLSHLILSDSVSKSAWQPQCHCPGKTATFGDTFAAVTDRVTDEASTLFTLSVIAKQQH